MCQMREDLFNSNITQSTIKHDFERGEIMAKQATCHTCVYAHWDRAAVDAEPGVGVAGAADVREPAGLVRAD